MDESTYIEVEKPSEDDLCNDGPREHEKRPRVELATDADRITDNSWVEIPSGNRHDNNKPCSSPPLSCLDEYVDIVDTPAPRKSSGADGLDGRPATTTTTAAVDSEDGRWLIGASARVEPPAAVVTAPRGAVTSQQEHSVATVTPHQLEPNTYYPMNVTPKKGIFVIINNVEFLPGSDMEDYPRKGSDVDAQQMCRLFSELGFEIHEHRNVTAVMINNIFQKLSELDYSSYSAFGCCILSHGEENVIFGTDRKVEIKSITSKFRGPKLAGKPKIFIFQACQGSEYMDPVVPEDEVMETDGRSEKPLDLSLPSEADFIYAYSTVPGYYSWRNSQKGSWFVQSIVRIFRDHAHKLDVGRMLTRVNAGVADFKSQTGQRRTHNKRQISSIVSQLRYDLYLFPSGPLNSDV